MPISRPRGHGAPDDAAPERIHASGGSRIQAIAQVVAGRTVSGHWLASATVELFEQYGFQRVRQVGKHAWIVSRVLDPA
ncbi:hypothetical protein ABN028_28915 [Actinopolymorpha sp. B17G11]|uniref:hypothetical protein n=1 Tax=unclassified Actinopolymorpha TaxID=2627063 RepID=UPI0032D94DF4